MTKIAKIISGGQTGVGRAALDFARDYGIPYGGIVPKGGITEDCRTAPGILRYYPQLQEASSEAYSVRSYLNVKAADATVVVRPRRKILSRGTNSTILSARELNRPLKEVEPHQVRALIEWIDRELGDELVINFAGPLASEWREGYSQTYRLLEDLFCAE